MDHPETPRPLSPWRRALREPLLHFVALGALIFAADQATVALRGDPSEIVIPASARKEARDTFVAGMNREPTPVELKVLLDRWRDNEVLYREGLALGLDKGDSAIRDRIIFKSMSVTQSGITLPSVDEATLRQWYEAHRNRYDVPARFDFQEAVVLGDATPESLQKFALALNGQGDAQAESSLRVFKDRPRHNLVASYGESFAQALEKQVAGSWNVLQSRDGPRLVRLELVKAAKPSSFEDVKDHVYQDWRDEQGAERTHQAIDAMARKYRIRMEGEGS